MQNDKAAISRRLSDPDFQGLLVQRLLGVCVAMAAVTIASVSYSVWLQTRPSQTRYFLVDGRNPPRPVVALTSPVVDDTQLREWTVRAVLAVYNVNYHDYAEQLNTAGRRFTTNGWNSFATSYIQSGNFDAMKRARMLCSAETQRAAVIREAKIDNGRLAYTIQFPILQTCENTQQSSPNNLLITATVIRTDDVDKPDGLAIDQLVATRR
jgi:intracellular multiplication protein IcmL